MLHKPTAKQPTAKQPTAKQPTAKQPTAKQPTEGVLLEYSACCWNIQAWLQPSQKFKPPILILKMKRQRSGPRFQWAALLQRVMFRRRNQTPSPHHTKHFLDCEDLTNPAPRFPRVRIEGYLTKDRARQSR